MIVCWKGAVAMDREEAFEFLDRTARGIAEMFGSTCETLVHDMGDRKSVV